MTVAIEAAVCDAAVVREVTVGEAICALIEAWGITHAFGVISIHNMPILDPLGERGKVRYISARGEAGAVNMADAHARVTGGLGVAFTSTGTAAGNAAGALVEALTAGSPVIHITGQVPREHLDLGHAYIHEAPAQLQMLEAVSKKAFRIEHPDQTISVMLEAASCALSAPRGPVSVEIPIDVQAARITMPANLPQPNPQTVKPRPADIARLADILAKARRPVLLLGGGAKGAGEAATRLANLGVAIVTSTCGRGIVAENHPMSIGAFNCTQAVQELYDSCDLMIVAGSRLRGNESWTYKLRLPAHTAIVDVDPGAGERGYRGLESFVSDARLMLEALAEAIEGRLVPDPALANDIAACRAQMEAQLRSDIAPYDHMVDELQKRMCGDMAWVRDVTISNSMWGNRYLRIPDERAGVHAVGGGIGQGLPMGIGAALGRRNGAIVLSGDGGLNLCLGELATAADEGVPMTLLLMNDKGYGVIRNIQDVHYGGRKHFSNIQVPDFEMVAGSLGLDHLRVDDLALFGPALDAAIASGRPNILEIDMIAIGNFDRTFAGPPTVDRK